MQIIYSHLPMFIVMKTRFSNSPPFILSSGVESLSVDRMQVVTDVIGDSLHCNCSRDGDLTKT